MKKITIDSRKKGEELLQTLVKKAWESATFKEQLINNPKVVIEKVLDKKLTISKESKIIIEDQTNPNIIYLNIPKMLEIDNFELTEEELEKVSGGFACGGLCIATVLGGIAAGAQIIQWFGEGWDSVE